MLLTGAFGLLPGAVEGLNLQEVEEVLWCGKRWKALVALRAGGGREARRLRLEWERTFPRFKAAAVRLRDLVRLELAMLPQPSDQTSADEYWTRLRLLDALEECLAAAPPSGHWEAGAGRVRRSYVARARQELLALGIPGELVEALLLGARAHRND